MDTDKSKRYSGMREPLGRSIVRSVEGKAIVTVDGKLLPSPFDKTISDRFFVQYDWGRGVTFAARHLAYAIIADYLGSAEIPSEIINLFAEDVIQHLPEKEWYLTSEGISDYLEKYVGEENEQE